MRTSLPRGRNLGCSGVLLCALASASAAPAQGGVPMPRSRESASPPQSARVAAAPASSHGLDRPMGEAWIVSRAWDAESEHEYGAFVARIGRAVARGRCHVLSACLNDPAINPLHEPGAAPLRFLADCADVPYILRAYFAYRRGLPFAHAAAMRGAGRDPRYLSGARADGLVRWSDYPTPRALLERIGNVVHSGYLRTAPGVEPSDFYQAAIRPGAVRPGTVYYDPNGHVLVVYEVRRDGELLLFDGHPGGRLTFGRFEPGFVLGRAALGGGFKNFRPTVYRDGVVAQLGDGALGDFGGEAQFLHAGARGGGFYNWVTARMTAPRRPHRRATVRTAVRAPRTAGAGGS